MNKTFRFFLSIFLSSLLLVPNISSAAILKLNNLNANNQFLATTTGTSSMHMRIVSLGADTHQFQWDGIPWRIDQGGTGASSFTNGSILFFNSIFSQDNQNFFWNATSKSLGIRNSTPQHALDVSGAIYSRLVNTNSSIDWNTGNVQSLILTSNQILTFNNAQAGGEYKLIIEQDNVGGRTVTWPNNVKWPGGVAPTLTTIPQNVDLISLVYTGTAFLGSYNLNYQFNNQSPGIVTIKLWGGGGAGSHGSNAMGGGAGAYVNVTGVTVSAQGYPIKIGQGGTPGNGTIAGLGGLGYANGGNGATNGTNQAGGGGGGSSAFASLYIAAGGGGGAARSGGNFTDVGPTGANGTSGGNGGNNNGGIGGGGGGGAAATNGGNAIGTSPGAGGTGATLTSGVNGDGGNGGINNAGGSSAGTSGNGMNANGSTGGTGSGGAMAGANGGIGESGAGANGGDNNGGSPGAGGGGAEGGSVGSNGGNGRVEVWYRTDGSDGISTLSTGGSVSTFGAYTVHVFTSDGTFTPVLSN